MNKNTFESVKLNKGEIAVYDFGEIKLYAYQTCDPIGDEVFVLVRDGKGVVIELPCFFDNIEELKGYFKAQNIELTSVMVAYHAAGASFAEGLKTYGTKSSEEYNKAGGGFALVQNFKGAFGEAFDSEIANPETILGDGEVEIDGIKMVIKSNAEAYDIELPQINCVYTHMMGHDCHSIVAGAPHADGIISQLNYYIRHGFDLVLTSHYTPEDLKDAKIKVDYLNDLKEIADTCETAEEMREKVNAKYIGYSGLNYLDMTVGFFFPAK